MKYLSAKNIAKSFLKPTRVDVLKGLDLEVNEGEAIAIMGKSGEGKSTLLHILGALDMPSSGEIEIRGEKLKPKDAPLFRQKHIGFIFQSFNLLDDHTVLENVLMPARIARQNCSKGSPAYQRALALLDEVGLTERASFLAKLLSGGEKQRVSMARALMNDPDIILADEPSGNLDQYHSEMIHHLLINLVRRHNKALIVATHDSALAHLCDRTLILKGGTLQ